MKRILLAILLLASATCRADDRPLTIFAAASLSEVLREIGAMTPTNEFGAPVFSFDGSGTLARQIERGAPADVFISAATEWMDFLVEKNLVDAKHRAVLARNTLVIVVPASAPTNTLTPSDLPSLARVAIGDPATVPAGAYAMQSFAAHGIADAMSNRLVFASNVRAALALVDRGEADAGVVYATDARVTPGVRVAFTFDAADHKPIVYEIAPVTASDRPTAAKAFFWTLETPEAKAVLERAGFLPAD